MVIKMNVDSPSIRKALEQLEQAVKMNCADNVVSCEVFINATEVNITCNSRSAEGLKKSGISMRNIRGDFIK
jgi:hypothetical protein